MKTKQAAPVADLWEVPTPPPAPSEPAPRVLSPEAQALVAELAPYGVQVNLEQPCPVCGCPLDYPLRLYPDTRLCCRCFPAGRVYGYARQQRIHDVFSRRVW